MSCTALVGIDNTLTFPFICTAHGLTGSRCATKARQAKERWFVETLQPRGTEC